LLAAPGLLIGELPIETCQMAVYLLREQYLSGTDKSGDSAYSLAGHLLATQLNLAARAEYCPAVEETVQAA
jgi:hypothetical protein